MAKKKQLKAKLEESFEFEESQEESQVEEFMEIGGSPVPGITLRQVLRGHTGIINRIAWSPDGRYLASPSEDQTIHIWDIESKKSVIILKGHENMVYTVAWSPDGKLLASGSHDKKVIIWITKTWTKLKTISFDDDYVFCLAWSSNGHLAIGNVGNLIIKETNSWNTVKTLQHHKGYISSLAWSPNNNFLASGSSQSELFIWDASVEKPLKKLKGHLGAVSDIYWWDNSVNLITCGLNENGIRVWDIKAGKQTISLEGHTEPVTSITLLEKMKLLFSKSDDKSIRIWRTDTWRTIATFSEENSNTFATNLELHPHLPILATIGERGLVIRIWDIDPSLLIGNTPPEKSIHYTTAKLVLVGDSGVGKTGLGWRLAHNEFKEHSSTHGQQFWVVPELKKTREDGTECEAVLWDLAGQHIYRSIHSIFLDDVDASLVLFDPTNRQEPLKGAQFWLEQLKGKKQLPPTVLVGARLDRGAPVLSQQELDQFCQKYGISGGYIGTSSKSGEGLDKLLESLKDQIPWEQMTTTVTTVTFKRIKEFVLSLKEKPDRKGVLVKPEELRSQLEAADKDWEFSDAEMMTAVGHLANHGYVTILKSSSGEEYILLVPELLASVAASIFLHADKHPRELGAINETELLQGKYPVDEFKGLEKEEQQVLLDATVVRFLQHSLCFRETLGNDNLLIFPSLIKQKRPLKDDVPATDDISYIVRGRVENIYASLVVLLGYTSSFTRINQWANQAQYETDKGNICGFRLVEDREGEIEFILYYGDEMPEEERVDFQALFEQFLYQRDVEITPFPPVICPKGHRQERATVVKRLREGKESVFCEECGAKTDLPKLEAQQTIGIEASDWLKREEAIARLRSVYETHLVRVKGYRRQWATPRCFISHVEEQKEFAERLAHDLADAGVFVIDEVSKVESNDNIIIVDSKAYKEAWEKNGIPNDVKLIKPRFADGKRKGLLSINLSGVVAEHNIKLCVSGSFCDPTHYAINLFDLVLNLYAIPLNHTGFTPLRQSLHTQWEQTLAQKIKWGGVTEDPLPNGENKKEIFFSYAWRGESENIVNEIDQAFQKRGVTIIRDKRDLNYKGSIKEFMERIGRGQGVVVVISDKYLKSKNCMFELIQIAENKQFKDRIFPVVLSDADIYDAVKRIEYIKYWEAKKKELNKAMKSVGSEHLQGIREEIDLFDNIRDEIAKLTDVLQDMNTLTPDMHRDSDFQTLFDAVMKKLEE